MTTVKNSQTSSINPAIKSDQVQSVAMDAMNNNTTCSSSSKPGKRRTKIPPRPERPLNILNFLKTTLGRELTRMSFPLVFNEPLSMLQRAIEFLEFAHILDKAAEPGVTPELQAGLVCLFMSANFLRISDRYKKPFNPLLCETFELDRWDDKEQYRFIVEQVEHHPPTSGIFGESKKGWTYQSNFSANSNFKMMKCSVEIKPAGLTNIYFKNTDTTFIISRPSSTYYVLHSHPAIAVTGDTKIEFVNGGLLQSQSILTLPSGHQEDGNKNTQNCPSKTSLAASNSSKAESQSAEKTKNAKAQNINNKVNQSFSIKSGTDASDMMSGKKTGIFGRFNAAKSEYHKLYGVGKDNKYCVKSDNYTEGCDLVDEKGKIIFGHRRADCPGEAQKHENTHNLADFSIQLNQFDPFVCPTDSRFRPDQRLMEYGDYDTAEILKSVLENRQRYRRKNNCNLTPRWFSKISDKSLENVKPPWIMTTNYFEEKAKKFSNIENEAGEAMFDFSDGLLSPKSSRSHIDTDSLRNKAVYKSNSKISSSQTSLSANDVDKIRDVINEYNRKEIELLNN